MSGAAGLGQRLGRPDRPVLLFSITPPRASTSAADRQRVADVTVQRLRPLDLDALILYDIDDESDRNGAERPFPYLPTVDPGGFAAAHLQDWERPVVVYRCVGKYDQASLGRWLRAQHPDRVGTVLVGASSSTKPVRTSLTQAHALWRATAPAVPLGGVAVPERHARRGDEHRRMLAKQAAGCSYFVSQIVYDTGAATELAADYRQACSEAGVAPAPVVFTLSVCGSTRTLAFLNWLGVDLPGWMREELERAEDPVAVSAAQCLAVAHELAAACERLGLRYGFNVESVSIRRAEIDASVRLARQLGERRAALGQRRSAPVPTAGEVMAR
ncbi:methylenetetrahydrofolate reductase [Ornithinicoccus halotolerans]|uniref:methylenetetrahydrofolate reductase n=1 Tax=Ornithinicoccus halotolerans TaxID=1748220 RepID=UPI001E2B8B9C|nr:5,10-methylenetetrahydrofolate reductase [Ornithinicoccus halotolerans]